MLSFDQILVFVVLLFILISCFAAETPEFVGRDFNLNFADLLSGKEIATVDTSSGRLVTLVVFWSINCGRCLQEIPELNAIYSEWWPQGLEII